MRVIFALNQEQTSRAKEIVSKVKAEMKEKDPEMFFSGNLLGQLPRTEDFINFYYQKGQITLIISRALLMSDFGKQFFAVLQHVFNGLTLKEYTVEKYQYDDRVPVWFMGKDQYWINQYKTGKTKQGPAFFIPMFKYLDDDKELESWQETLVRDYLANLKPLPRPGTPAYVQAVAGGVYEELKQKHDVLRAYEQYLNKNTTAASIAA